MQRNKLLLPLALAFVFLRGTACRANPDRANPARADLVAAMTRLQSQVRAWRIEYQSDSAAGKYVHRVVAAISPNRFYHWGAHGADHYDWRQDPYQQRLLINGSDDTVVNTVVEFPFARSFHLFELPPTAPLPGTAPRELIFTALGLWPFPARPAPHLPDGTPCDLAEVAASPDYRLSAARPLLDGHPCAILENPGHDRLWFDLDRDLHLAAREFTDPQSGARLARIELTDYRPVAPGVFFPMRWHNIVDDPLAPLDSWITVQSVQINDQVNPAQFTFHPLPGSVQILDDGRFRQFVPGGPDYLDNLIAWVRRQSPPPPTPSPLEPACEWTLCAASFAACGVRLHRRRSSRRACTLSN